MRISEKALQEKTGKTSAQWFKLLDAIKAEQMKAYWKAHLEGLKTYLIPI